MSELKLEDFFIKTACDFCGKCLSDCPEFGGNIENAPSVVRNLVNGDYVKEVLENCSTCMSCNSICPHECNPYGLILFRWYERSKRTGVPLRASLVMPLEPGNAWHRIMDGLPSDEKALLDIWTNRNIKELKGKILFAGCNLQISPYLASNKLLGDIPVFGRPDLCCGEVYYRMGILDRVDSVARNLEDFYRQTEITEMIAYCQACYNMMRNILPGYFGAQFQFEVSYFGDILAEKVFSGEFPVKNKLKGLKVTVQDPCHSKLLGAEFQDQPRRILEYMGCEVREMKHSHEMSLCCGLGHGAARFSILDMAGGISRRLKEARATGSDYLVVYCNSCELLFSVGTQTTPYSIPIYHINELVLEALGDRLPRRNLQRARSMMSQLFLKGATKIISRKRISLSKD